MRVKLGLVAICAAWAAVVAPAAAQTMPSVGGFDGVKFVEAVRKRDGNTAMELLKARGASILNAKDSKGETALIAAIARRDETWTSFLLQEGADPGLAASSGDTPLIAAARSGFLTGVGELLNLGVKVDAANRMGETALIIAVQQRQVPIVKLLLAAGANPNKTDNAAGYSALDYAKRDNRARDIVTLIESSRGKIRPKTSDKLEDFKL